MGLFDFFRNVSERHENFKKKVHGFRIPLSKNGQRFMTLVYITVPIVGGLFVMQWAENIAKENLGADGKKLNFDVSVQQREQIARRKEALAVILKKAQENQKE